MCAGALQRLGAHMARCPGPTWLGGRCADACARVAERCQQIPATARRGRRCMVVARAPNPHCRELGAQDMGRSLKLWPRGRQCKADYACQGRRWTIPEAPATFPMSRVRTTFRQRAAAQPCSAKVAADYAAPVCGGIRPNTCKETPRKHRRVATFPSPPLRHSRRQATQ